MGSIEQNGFVIIAPKETGAVKDPGMSFSILDAEMPNEDIYLKIRELRAAKIPYNFLVFVMNSKEDLDRYKLLRMAMCELPNTFVVAIPSGTYTMTDEQMIKMSKDLMDFVKTDHEKNSTSSRVVAKGFFNIDSMSEISIGQGYPIIHHAHD